MSDYDNTNRGAIWKNDEKRGERDFTGSLDVDGIEYWVSGWKRAPNANPKAPALKFTVRKKELRAADARRRPQQSAPPPPDDDIPL